MHPEALLFQVGERLWICLLFGRGFADEGLPCLKETTGGEFRVYRV